MTAVKTFLELLEDKRALSMNELKDSILKDRMFQRAKLRGGEVPTGAMNADGANRHLIKSCKLLIAELDVHIAREKESPTDETEPLLVIE